MEKEMEAEQEAIEQKKALERGAREQMKLKLLADIRTDIIICQLEGWDPKEYINEIKELINSFSIPNS